MIESVGFPISCYIALAIAAVAAVYSFSLRNASIGLPMLAVIGTVAAWYLGDAFYNDYHEYVLNLGVDYLDQAWWQVSLFLIGFMIFAPFVHRWMNKILLGGKPLHHAVSPWRLGPDGFPRAGNGGKRNSHRGMAGPHVHCPDADEF